MAYPQQDGQYNWGGGGKAGWGGYASQAPGSSSPHASWYQGADYSQNPAYSNNAYRYSAPATPNNLSNNPNNLSNPLAQALQPSGAPGNSLASAPAGMLANGQPYNFANIQSQAAAAGLAWGPTGTDTWLSQPISLADNPAYAQYTADGQNPQVVGYNPLGAPIMHVGVNPTNQNAIQDFTGFVYPNNWQFPSDDVRSLPPTPATNSPPAPTIADRTGGNTTPDFMNYVTAMNAAGYNVDPTTGAVAGHLAR